MGVPLWLIAAAIVTLVVRNRALRHRPGNMAVRLRSPGKRWKRGHALWVHEVFAFRGSPAAWDEVLEPVRSAVLRPATSEEAHKLRRLDGPAIATLTTDSGSSFEVAAAGRDEALLMAPFAATARRANSDPRGSASAGSEMGQPTA
jgi:hypothetical protein